MTENKRVLGFFIMVIGMICAGGIYVGFFSLGTGILALLLILGGLFMWDPARHDGNESP